MSEIDEVKHLLSIATFPGVKQLLENYSRQLSKEELPVAQPIHSASGSHTNSESVAGNHAVPVAAALVTPPRPAVEGVFVPIDDFAWDQVCIYLYRF